MVEFKSISNQLLAGCFIVTCIVDYYMRSYMQAALSLLLLARVITSRFASSLAAHFFHWILKLV